jgi:hypothetical protein
MERTLRFMTPSLSAADGTAFSLRVWRRSSPLLNRSRPTPSPHQLCCSHRCRAPTGTGASGTETSAWSKEPMQRLGAATAHLHSLLRVLHACPCAPHPGQLAWQPCRARGRAAQQVIRLHRAAARGGAWPALGANGAPAGCRAHARCAARLCRNPPDLPRGCTHRRRRGSYRWLTCSFHPDGRLYVTKAWPIVRSNATGEVAVAQCTIVERGNGDCGVMRV